MEQYRLIKVEEKVGDPNDIGYPFPSYDGSDVITITRYLVQVRGFIFWHRLKLSRRFYQPPDC